MMEKPKRLMFYGKNILAVADPDSIAFGSSAGKDGQAGNPQIAMSFTVSDNQKAAIYAVPEGSDLVPNKIGLIPGATQVLWIKAITAKTMPYVIEALRNAGWTGSKLMDLKNGHTDGLGETVVKLAISVKEKREDTGEYLVNKEGKFNPQMNVDWVNSAAGFAFKEEVSDDALAALDAEFSAELAPPAGARQKSRPTPPRPTVGGNGAAPAGAANPSDVPPMGIDDDIPF